MVQSMFQRVGGFSAISRVVMDFYDRILDSEKAGDFFDGVNIDKMIDHQTKFISSLMGGPSAHTDVQLKRSHAKPNIDDESFDEMVEILCGTLTDHSISPDDVAAVRNHLEIRRSLIVTN